MSNSPVCTCLSLSHILFDGLVTRVSQGIWYWLNLNCRHVHQTTQGVRVAEVCSFVKFTCAVRIQTMMLISDASNATNTVCIQCGPMTVRRMVKLSKPDTHMLQKMLAPQHPLDYSYIGVKGM